MTRRLQKLTRKSYPLLAAGILLQTGGCTVDLNTLVSGLATSIVNTFVADLIFGIFNVGGF